MALTAKTSLLSDKSSIIPQYQPFSYSNHFSLTIRSTTLKPISAVHATDSSNSKTSPVAASVSGASVPTAAVETKAHPKKWALDSWNRKRHCSYPSTRMKRNWNRFSRPSMPSLPLCSRVRHTILKNASVRRPWETLFSCKGETVLRVPSVKQPI